LFISLSICKAAAEHLRAEGFAIERLERAKLAIVECVAARKPASASPQRPNTNQ
jgi:hypothetical protein